VNDPAAQHPVMLTHFCKPRAGFHCWQFDPTAAVVPTWVMNWTNRQKDGRVEFCDRDGSTDLILDPGDWLVVFDEDSAAVAVYSADEFAKTFDLVAPERR
jgi:hypothetical protein